LIVTIISIIPLVLANIVVLFAFFRREPIEVQNYRAFGIIAYCALAIAIKYVCS
jgi:hypothetical protein